MTPWLSDAEVEDLCEGLIQPAAQARYMQRVYGLVVKRKPNGRPLVLRSALDRIGAPPVMEPPNAAPAAPAQLERPQPNFGALQLRLARR